MHMHACGAVLCGRLMPRVQLGPINSVELCEVSVWCELDWPIALRSVLADNANNKPSWVGINMWGLGWRPAGRGVILLESGN